MSSQDRKHGREAARRRAARAAARAETRRRQRRMQVVIGGVVVAALLLIVFVVTRPDDDTPTSASTTTTSTSATKSTLANEERVIKDDPSENMSGDFEYGTGECPPAEKPAEPKRQFDAAPKRCLTDGVDYAAVVETSEGAFTIDLLEDRAPGTVNNFVVLARWGYFDGVTFHRVVKGFVDQAGDPTGSGSGGPGYTIADELPAAARSYAKWAVAMANPGQVDQNGSQWFICIDCVSTLTAPAYSLFGQVVESTDVAQAINDLATPEDKTEPPVTITSITIQES
jgi:peptidylprolyl isomerase